MARQREMIDHMSADKESTASKNQRMADSGHFGRGGLRADGDAWRKLMSARFSPGPHRSIGSFRHRSRLWWAQAQLRTARTNPEFGDVA
jgi:hypothetical protein